MDRNVKASHQDSKTLKMTASSLFPILSSNRKLWRSGYLVHGAITALAASVFIWAADRGDAGVLFNVLAYYMTYFQCVVVYYLCGRANIWPAMVGTFFLCWFLMLSTPLFSVVAPAFRSENTVALMKGSDFGSAFIGYFIGAGMAEEFYKAIPLLVLAVMTLLRRRGTLSSKSDALGLSEPLDGIALGVAAGAAFAVAETLVQYVPDAIDKSGGDVLVGLLTLIVRGISQLSGHLAYSGYLGYFIGWAVLRPRLAPIYLAVGFVTTSALHGLWDALIQVHAPSVVMTALAATTIAFLIAAILKARRVSPTRSQNFATVMYPATEVAVPAASAAPRSATSETGRPARREEEVPSSRAAGRPGDAHAVVLQIGPFRCSPVPGFKIEPRMLGSAGAGRGREPIAEVLAATDGSAPFRLRNLSDRPWRVRLADGFGQEIGREAAVNLSPGTVIDFGGIEGVVQAG